MCYVVHHMLQGVEFTHTPACEDGWRRGEGSGFIPEASTFEPRSRPEEVGMEVCSSIPIHLDFEF